MQTAVFVGKQIAEFDSKITDKLMLEVGSEKAVRQEHMQIGIRNEGGDIYRAIGVTGLGEFLDSIGKLVEIGLFDELQHEDGPRNGYDAIFKQRV